MVSWRELNDIGSSNISQSATESHMIKCNGSKPVPFYYSVVVTKCHGGKRALWHARKDSYPGVCGAGNTADNAIRDLAKQINSWKGKE